MDEKLELQQQSIQAQLDKSIATTEMLSKQVNSIQLSLDTLTQTMNTFMLKMAGGTPSTPGPQPHQQGQQKQQQMSPQRHETGAQYVTPQGHFAMANFSSPTMGEQTQQSSLYQANQMQHMNAGYNPKFMSPMYGPAENQTQGQHYSQQLAGPHTTNQMDMSPKRVGN
eukprot:scaffold93194_cov53-Attheya_sp.AAC.3